jgi:hypothetical protein
MMQKLEESGIYTKVSRVPYHGPYHLLRMQFTSLCSLMYHYSVNNGLQGHHKVLQITFCEYADIYVGTGTHPREEQYHV